MSTKHLYAVQAVMGRAVVVNGQFVRNTVSPDVHKDVIGEFSKLGQHTRIIKRAIEAIEAEERLLQIVYSRFLANGFQDATVFWQEIGRPAAPIMFTLFQTTMSKSGAWAPPARRRSDV